MLLFGIVDFRLVILRLLHRLQREGIAIAVAATAAATTTEHAQGRIVVGHGRRCVLVVHLVAVVAVVQAVVVVVVVVVVIVLVCADESSAIATVTEEHATAPIAHGPSQQRRLRPKLALRHGDRT